MTSIYPLTKLLFRCLAVTDLFCWTDNTTAVNSDASSRRYSVLQRKGFEILYYTINLYDTKIMRHIQIHTKGKIARK